MPGPKKFVPTDAERALADAIRKQRETLGLSQEQVARHLGISVRSLHRLERAERPVPLRELDLLEQVFGTFAPSFGSGETQGRLFNLLGFTSRELLQRPEQLQQRVANTRLTEKEAMLVTWFRGLDEADQEDAFEHVMEALAFRGILERLTEIATGSSAKAARAADEMLEFIRTTHGDLKQFTSIWWPRRAPQSPPSGVTVDIKEAIKESLRREHAERGAGEVAPKPGKGSRQP